MCVLKKPSTPSFGVKLFVSLVLLAISLCLVTCADEQSKESNSAAPEKPTILKKDVTISKADFIELVNKSSKLSYQLSDADLTKRIGDLSRAVPSNKKTVLGTAETPGPFEAYSVTGTPSAKSEFHFILPKDKHVKDLLESNKDALKEAFLKDDTKFQAKLESVLKDTTAFVKTLVTHRKNSTSETITLNVLEDHLLNKYSLDGDSLKSGTSSTPYNIKNTLLFAPIDVVRSIGIKVYIPKSTVKEFLDDCASNYSWKSGENDAPFMKHIINHLSAPSASPASGSPPPIEVAWADILDESKKFVYDSTNSKMLRDDTAFSKLTPFEYKSIVDKAGTSFEGEREKFRVSFKIPGGLNYKEYLDKFIEGITGTGADDNLKLRDCFANLVIKANQDASFNSIAVDLFKSADIEDKSITYDDLMTELKTLLKDIQFEFEITENDFKDPAAENTRFSYNSAEGKLKLLQLSYPVLQPPMEDKEIVKFLVSFAKDETKKVVYHSKEDAINAFFTHCWNAEGYDNAMKAMEGKGSANNLPPGGNNNSAADQQSGTANNGDEKNKPKEEKDYTIVIIIVSVVGGGLLLGVIAFIFIKRKKHESNEASA